MSRQFPLAGLLRLRQLEQDQAAARFGAVNARFRALAGREEAAREQADGITSEVDSSAALRAVAAARASSMSMLADLRALSELAASEREDAQVEFAAARARTIGLEKLEARHSEAVAAAELAAEQGVLDELGTAAGGASRRPQTVGQQAGQQASVQQVIGQQASGSRAVGP
ncbi:flagellar export protein FliJ [Sinomonas albida]|uniref:flagellar export protein FliJ n=1 Tax=Sinomonas albida TaxID=369942 RepID=UPI00301AA250